MQEIRCGTGRFALRSPCGVLHTLDSPEKKRAYVLSVSVKDKLTNLDFSYSLEFMLENA